MKRKEKGYDRRLVNELYAWDDHLADEENYQNREAVE